MATRFCTKCGLEKDIEQFPLRNQYTQRRQSYCVDCRSAMGKDWYERNRDYQIENANKLRVEYRQALREYVLAYLSTHPCTACGESDPTVLEFHHVRGEKLNDVSVLIGRGSSLEKLKAEIEKCDVYCANCHRRLETKLRGFFRGKN